MIDELIMAGTVVAGMAYVYHLGVEHTKEKVAMGSRIRSLREELADCKESMRGRNEYIKRLEADVLDGASDDSLSGVLTRLFSTSESSVHDAILPAVGGSGEAGAGVHSGGDGASENN